MANLLPREASTFLQRWRKKPTRKPLILRGARQVGKSSLVRLHGQDYDHFVELNLERPRDRELFAGLPPMGELLARIALRSGLRALGPDTLLFIDEIQGAPEAIQQLRFLYEDHPTIPVIAAGSLLEFALGEVQSFPVGRVEYYVLRPLSFREYLRWRRLDALADVLTQVPTPTFGHEELKTAFYHYTSVGGMPSIVKAIEQGAEQIEINELYEAIWTSYRDDAEKYARNDRQRGVLRHLLATAAAADGRIALANFGGSNFRSDDVGPAFRALELAGILRLIYPTTALQPPATPALRKRPRIQLLDTGLLNYARGIAGETLSSDGLGSGYRGRIAEHIVTQEVIAQRHEPSWTPVFWTREKPTANAEVDLILPYQGRLYPLEIKAGMQGRLRSLHEFVERAGLHVGIRAHAGAYSMELVSTPRGHSYHLLNLPFYAVGDWKRWLNHAVNSIAE